MVLLMFDGFESAPTVRPNIVCSAGFLAVTGRDGVGRGLRAGNNNAMVVNLPTPVTQLIMGVGVKWSASHTGASNGSIMFRTNTGATEQCRLHVSGTNFLELKSSGGTVLATSVIPFVIGAWHYLEVKLTVADSGGIFICKVDGVEHINFTGDTKSGGAVPTTIDQLYFQVPTSGNATEIDDLVIMDATGSAPYNDFIGERMVKGKRPAGNGVSSDLLGSDGDSTDNYLLVDDDPVNTTDYVASSTSGDKDFYALSASTGLASVDAVQATAYAVKSDSGTKSIKTILRSAGGTEDASADLALSTTWVSLYGAFAPLDPTGAAWTPSNVNSIQAGVEVV